MARIYLAGHITGPTTPRVFWVDPYTYVPTMLPAITGAAGLEICGLKVIAENDIWVSFDGSGAVLTHPRFAHYNGTDWTIYNLTILPSGTDYAPTWFHVVSSDEIYICVPYDYVCKWDGAAWSIHINCNTLPSPVTFENTSTIAPGSTANDMWFADAKQYATGNDVVYWNGATLSQEDVHTSGTHSAGIVTYKTEVLCAMQSASSDGYVRTGPATWAAEFAMPLANSRFLPVNGHVLWHDTVADVLWFAYESQNGSPRFGVGSWNGTTCVVDENTVDPLDAHAGRIAGFESVGGNDAWTYYCADNTLYSRDPDGTWAAHTDISGLGAGTYGYVETLGEYPGIAPQLQNQSPAADETLVRADTDVYLEVVDLDNDVVASSVEIWIEGTLAWGSGRAMPGFEGSVAVVTNGYGYTITYPADFLAGEVTVRVVALDSGDRRLDETYSFSAIVVVPEPEDIAAEETTAATVGLDLYLDTAHDLEVQNYDLRLVAGVDEVAQHLLVGLRLFRGEWYLDDEAGVPYYRDVFISAPQSRVIDALFRQEILSDVDIEALTEFDLDIDRATRRLDLSFRAVSSIGEVDVSVVFP